MPMYLITSSLVSSLLVFAIAVPQALAGRNTVYSVSMPVCELNPTSVANLKQMGTVQGVALDLYNDGDDCLKRLGPDSIKVLNCMSVAYKTYGKSQLQEVDRRAFECALSVSNSPDVQAAALAYATKLVKERFTEQWDAFGKKYESGKIQPEFEKLSESEKEFLTLAGQQSQPPIAPEDLHQQFFAAGARRANAKSQMIKHDGVKVTADGKLDMRAFPFKKAFTKTSPDDTNYKKSPQYNTIKAMFGELTAVQLLDLYNSPSDKKPYRAIHVGDSVIIPNYQGEPKVLSKAEYDDFVAGTMKRLHDYSVRYLKNAEKYKSPTDLMNRWYDELKGVKSDTTSTNADGAMESSFDDMTNELNALKMTWGVDTYTMKANLRSVQAALQSGETKIDDAIRNLDRAEHATKAALATAAVVAGGAYLVPILASSAAATSATGAFVLKATGTTATAFTAKAAVGVGFFGAWETGHAIAQAVNSSMHGGGSLMCNLGEQMLNRAVLGTAEAGPMAVGLGLALPALAPAISGMAKPVLGKLMSEGTAKVVAGKLGVGLPGLALGGLALPGAIDLTKQGSAEVDAGASEAEMEGQNTEAAQALVREGRSKQIEGTSILAGSALAAKGIIEGNKALPRKGMTPEEYRLRLPEGVAKPSKTALKAVADDYMVNITDKAPKDAQPEMLKFLASTSEADQMAIAERLYAIEQRRIASINEKLKSKDLSADERALLESQVKNVRGRVSSKVYRFVWDKFQAALRACSVNGG